MTSRTRPQLADVAGTFFCAKRQKQVIDLGKPSDTARDIQRTVVECSANTNCVSYGSYSDTDDMTTPLLAKQRHRLPPLQS